MALNKSQAEAVNFGNAVATKAYEKKAGLVDTFVRTETAEQKLAKSGKMQTAQALEALDSLEIYIASHAAEPTYWKALNNCVKIFGSNKELAKHHCFIPIIAGYPSFIQVLGGDSLHDDAEFHALVGSPLESMMRFLKN
jgi:hypothetical protein